jgi:hypothetical protein
VADVTGPEHRVAVGRFETVDRYRAYCSCGWRSPWIVKTEAQAEEDGAEHLTVIGER